MNVSSVRMLAAALTADLATDYRFGIAARAGRPVEKLLLEPPRTVLPADVYRPVGAVPIERPVEWIPGRPFKPNLLEFRVPSSGLTSPSLLARTRFTYSRSRSRQSSRPCGAASRCPAPSRSSGSTR